MADHKEPTDHLPPVEERADGDERTTAGSPYPGSGEPDERGGVREETAAEPDEPARHGVAKLPPGPH